MIVVTFVEDGSWIAVGSLPQQRRHWLSQLALSMPLVNYAETRSANRVDRTLRLHEDFTVGDVGAARHRVATRLYEVSAQRGRCYVPLEDELDVDGNLRIYPPDTSAYGFDMNQDVHHIVWFFQRVDAARMHDVVDSRLLHELIGWHAVKGGSDIHQARQRRQLACTRRPAPTRPMGTGLGYSRATIRLGPSARRHARPRPITCIDSTIAPIVAQRLTTTGRTGQMVALSVVGDTMAEYTLHFSGNAKRSTRMCRWIKAPAPSGH